MRVVAVDPGITSGIAVWRQADGYFYTDQVEGFIPAASFVRRELSYEGSAALVVESFTIGGARGKDSNQTIELIGALRWIAYLAGIPVIEQAPADVFGFMTDEKLRRAGMYVTGDHARSAAKHLAFFLLGRALLDPSILLPSNGEEED